MTDDITTMYQDAKRGVAYAMNEAMSELQRARIEGDRTAAADAVLKINDVSIRDQNLDRLYAQARQQPQHQAQAAGKHVEYTDERGNKRTTFLNDTELDHAHNATQHGTVEDRERNYAKGRHRYHSMLADGSYSRQTNPVGKY